MRPDIHNAVNLTEVILPSQTIEHKNPDLSILANVTLRFFSKSKIGGHIRRIGPVEERRPAKRVFCAA
jgi:hypothetical protein